MARLEARRLEVEKRLGCPLDLEGLVAALLDATARRGADAPAVPRRVLPGPKSDGFVEVLVREAETGRLLRRDKGGWRGISPAVGALVLREGDPTLDGDLLARRAIASATKAKGQEVPPQVERWVWIRSGGGCEIPGCTSRGQHLHHRTRRAEALDHHPDQLRLTCSSCHGAIHAGLMDEEGRMLPTGTLPTLGWVDQRALDRRLASREASA
jgi:hypothetical protein